MKEIQKKTAIVKRRANGGIRSREFCFRGICSREIIPRRKYGGTPLLGDWFSENNWFPVDLGGIGSLIGSLQNLGLFGTLSRCKGINFLGHLFPKKGWRQNLLLF